MNRFLLVLLLVVIFSFSSCSMTTIDDISEMSSIEMIEYTAKGVKKAAVTVGIIQNGQISYKVYVENGREISQREHVYEIGSITKTFTASLLSKAINENKVSLNNPISLFLNLPSKDYYPSIKV